MLCKCHWIMLYIVHFTAFSLGGGRFFRTRCIYFISLIVNLMRLVIILIKFLCMYRAPPWPVSMMTVCRQACCYFDESVEYMVSTRHNSRSLARSTHLDNLPITSFFYNKCSRRQTDRQIPTLRQVDTSTTREVQRLITITSLLHSLALSLSISPLHLFIYLSISECVC